MRYLYFKSKTYISIHNNQWIHSKLQYIFSLLESCSSKSQLVQIHAQLIRTQLISDSFLASRIVSLICSSTEPHMDYARKVFDQILQPNVLAWNSMIRGYTKNKSPLDGLLMYKFMLSRGIYPDSYTLSVVTRACAQVMGLQIGESVHAMVIRLGFGSDMFVMSGLVNLYGNSRNIVSARDVFDEMPERDVVTWTSILSSYGVLNKWDDVLQLFDEMIGEGLEPNKVTFMNLLSACGQYQNSEQAEWLHCQISKYGFDSDIDVSNSLISAYARCQLMPKALEVFTKMPVKNTISWNALIVGYMQNELHKEALKTFQEMVSCCYNAKPDEITISSALSACAQLCDRYQGNLLHSYVMDNNMNCDTFICNSLINMYAKCEDISMAEQIFREIPERDVVSWTAIISGYVKGGRFTEALNLFDEMRRAGTAPNAVTLVSLLSACSKIGSLVKGKEIHEYIKESNVIMDACLESALVDMYAKCGRIETALKVFNDMNGQNTLAFNSMITGLANYGQAEEAIKLFNKMEKLDRCKPDSVTLKAVLSACAHSGMVSEAFRIFHSMSKSYDVCVDLDHYGCMVDLLGRAGLVEQALNFVKNMPVKPNHVIWGSLLAACRVHHRPDIGEEIVNSITMPDAGAHVLVSNLYAESGRWDDVRRERELMCRNRIEKLPGCSSI
ncbi:Pentatricopeptide repeat-containing protein [Rhynchospora pubera]|uniref:Pentatricopeptide repeat-containing protein n=1 Tax=Rhynchospora pubera TaxID=906938 RepID=A0AAV8GN71_9POAL|nr:Pentatricopeptide repeat-containing protein [Rhynchospora pubera]